MAYVNPRIAEVVAKMPATKIAVRRARDRVAATARADFASHDHPGGHTITTTNGTTDAFVSLEGPAPLSVEFGHWQRNSDGSLDNQYVEGLHILGKAVAQAEAEGRRA